jgi:hypothetical protein
MHEDERSKEPSGHSDQCAERSAELQPPSPKRILTVCCAPLDALIKESSLVLTDKETWILYDDKGRTFPAFFCPFCGRPLCEVRPMENDARSEDSVA